MTKEIEKIKKSELVEKYKALEDAYDVLQDQYEALNDAYSELECDGADEMLYRKIDNLENKLHEVMESKYRNFLDDISSNTELQNKIYDVFKEYYDGLANLYGIDIPDLMYNTEKARKIDNYTNKKLIKIFEDHVKELDLYEGITGK